MLQRESKLRRRHRQPAAIHDGIGQLRQVEGCMDSGRWPNTALCDLVGIELPIVQAPIGGAATATLAAAVSNAGGLGMLGLGGAPVEEAVREVRETFKRTKKPFGVNTIMHWPPDDVIPLILDEGVKVLSFFWGDCSRFIQRAHRYGAIVTLSVGSVEEAREAVDYGVDVIIAQGWEAGGHVRGTISTMALVPAVVDAVGKVPVVAAGGIADGRGIAAAFALGAAGAWLGTRYLAASEAPLHPHYRRRIFESEGKDTLYTEDLFDIEWPNAPHRALKNESSRIWETAGRPPMGQRPGEGDVVARAGDQVILRYTCMTPSSACEGDIEEMSMWAGQGVGLVTREQSAAHITRELARDAQAVLARMR
jgi:nitronate monooxygenase